MKPCRSLSVSIGALVGEVPTLFDVCTCGTKVACLDKSCTEGAHVVVRRCKACTLRDKPGMGRVG